MSSGNLDTQYIELHVLMLQLLWTF